MLSKAGVMVVSENYESPNERIHYIKVRDKGSEDNYSKWSNVCTVAADWTALQLTRLRL